MPMIRELKIGDEKGLIPLFKILTGKEIIINTTDLIADGAITCMVIEENDELLGFGSLIIHQVPTKGKVARIEDVVIAENHQGKGLGTKLVLSLVDLAKKENVKVINLTSNPMRIGAQKLYESVGFSRGNTNTFYMSL